MWRVSAGFEGKVALLAAGAAVVGCAGVLLALHLAGGAWEKPVGRGAADLGDQGAIGLFHLLVPRVGSGSQPSARERLGRSGGLQLVRRSLEVLDSGVDAFDGRF